MRDQTAEKYVIVEDSDGDFRATCRAFERLCGYDCCWHDYTGDIRRVAPGVNFFHVNAFCPVVKYKLDKSSERCIRFDRVGVEAAARNSRQPFYKLCYAGALELVVPVMPRGRLAGVCFIGPFRLENPERPPPGTILDTPCPQQRKIASALDKLRVMTIPELDALPLLARLLVERLESLVNAAPVKAAFLSRRQLIERYFESEFRRQASLAGLAAALSLSESRASQVLAETFGAGFPELLAKYRLEYAKSLLANTYMSASSIAAQSGFSDAAYFFQVFKRRAGTTPLEFRRRHQKSGELEQT